MSSKFFVRNEKIWLNSKNDQSHYSDEMYVYRYRAF